MGFLFCAPNKKNEVKEEYIYFFFPKKNTKNRYGIEGKDNKLQVLGEK